MKKIIVLLLAIFFLMPVCLFVDADEGADIGLNISENADHTISIVISDDLATPKTKIEVPCILSNPIVKNKNNKKVYSEFLDGKVTFIAELGGVYNVVEDDNPDKMNYLDGETAITNSLIVEATAKDGSSVNVLDVITYEVTPSKIPNSFKTKYEIDDTKDIVAFNLDVYLGEKELKSLTLNTKVSVAINAINHNMPHQGNNNVWKYDVYRLHDDMWEKIASDLLENSDQKIVFKTDKFSTFVVVGKDSYINPNGSGYRAPLTGIE